MPDRAQLDVAKRPVSLAARALVLLVVVVLPASRVRAGGGPENVALVVNRASPASLTVANYFIDLRDLPPANVLHINWERDPQTVDVETFRTRLLGPVLKELESRGIAGQIDYLVYSSDLPFRVELKDDVARLPRQPRFPHGSLTGLTYLWQGVMKGDPNYLRLNSNNYLQRPDREDEAISSHGFRAWYGWGDDGRLLEAGGARYLLSTQLAVTSGRGNSLGEVVNYLRSSARSDGTKPEGTIYFAQNDDIRSRTRHMQYPSLLLALRELGVKAEVVEGRLPQNKDDVQGLMAGTASFDWDNSGSTIRGGAICEHLTSLGGVLFEGAGQTPLTEFLRHGAAGSSGAVTEPFALQQKFPQAYMHLHYARGCTLAEAYYQSVHGPYQLLVVGDPLCRPWANVPDVQVEGVEPYAEVGGAIELVPKASFEEEGEVDRFALFVDGVYVSMISPGGTFSLDTAGLPDGYHELRVVAFEAGPIETQGRKLIPVMVNNRGRRVQISSTARGTVSWNEALVLQGAAPGASSIVFYHEQRRLGIVDGEQGGLVIPAGTLGFGPVRLRAVAVGPDRQSPFAVSEPLKLVVKDTPALEAVEPPAGDLVGGLKLETEDAATVIKTTGKRDWLAEAGVEPGDVFQLSGYVHAGSEPLHQFHLSHSGPVELVIDGKRAYQAVARDPRQVSLLSVPLARGTHEVMLRGRAGKPATLDFRLGSHGTYRASAANFRCQP